MNEGRARGGLMREFLRRRESAKGHSHTSAPVVRHRGDFRFNTLSVLAIVLFLGIGFGLQVGVGALPPNEDVAMVAAGVLVIAGILFVLPYWATVVVAVAATWATLPVVFETDLSSAAAAVSVGLLVAPGIEVISQWDKIVVLRLGKFHRVRGPGPLILLPLLDSIAGYVDTRIRVTDFSAEQSLTRDTAPVHVDALAFWMVWDAHRAVLEVQEFQEAVILSAQTALRASIGANDLSTLLSERERLGREIQQIVDAKTNPWGITILSVEFKEILIPKELEDVLSRQAQAYREKKSRTILSEAEVDVADSFTKAADRYRDDPVALQLRAMNMVYESMRNKGGLVLVPSDALQGMNLGAVLGLKAYQERGAAGAASPIEPSDTRQSTESIPQAASDESSGEQPSSSDQAASGEPGVAESPIEADQTRRNNAGEAGR